MKLKKLIFGFGSKENDLKYKHKHEHDFFFFSTTLCSIDLVGTRPMDF